MEPSDNPSGGFGDSVGGQAGEQPPGPFPDETELSAANYTHPVQVMPCQIQSIVKSDDQGRRYVVLENLPLGKNYVASRINNGGEFAIGGTPAFISDALTNELKARAVQDSTEHRAQSWHVVALPDSNMSNETLYYLYRGSEATERYPIDTQLRPAQPKHQGSQPGLGFQQNSQAIQTTLVPQQSRMYDQQPMPAHNRVMGGYEQEYSSVLQTQHSQLNTPMPGNLSDGGGSTVMFPQEQLYSHAPQQGSIAGFGANSGPTQVGYHGQGNNTMFDADGGFPMQPLPQVHRPIFDRFGAIIGEQANSNDGGMYGGNLFNDNMHGTRMYNDFGYSQPHSFQGPQQQLDHPQELQGTHMGSDPQLADAAQSFYDFFTNNMDENEMDQEEHNPQEYDQEDSEGGEDDQVDNGPEEEIQDEGVAMGNTSGNDADNHNSPQAFSNQRPELPPAEVLWARERSPYRFQDRTGMGVCDYCDRIGHEAEACLKWDPDDYDKPVCTACNNKEHSLDECPKFRAMTLSEKQTLLVTKGAGRPGVRSQYHAWTRYVLHNSARLPLTRRFLQDLSDSPGSGAADVWKDWDYDQGVPDQFRDLVAEALAADHPSLVDERFMDGNHGFDRKVHTVTN
ncbi:hypothetical protein DHEL01_v211536 [Diaporthe helianthi]|uniref:Uncharacterized protein n=1 Tax=Diaporthe helianthi TaxID=158607 RepID=A0A2P5HII7_DIAHE|nr:hypothetical protein DHEL01_v211536 [Diaporthe helianthi]